MQTINMQQSLATKNDVSACTHPQSQKHSQDITHASPQPLNKNNQHAAVSCNHEQCETCTHPPFAETPPGNHPRQVPLNKNNQHAAVSCEKNG
jgi:hypothetical protein